MLSMFEIQSVILKRYDLLLIDLFVTMVILNL